ncbi:hypothetical protein LCGC14_1630850, partial [marine sediment metagenome]
GYDEDKENRPLIGRAGDMLRDAAERSGLNENEIFFTNVAKCATPENRPPTQGELKACSTYLQAELKHVKPKFIFAFGTEALNQITGKRHGTKGKGGAPGITKLQGKVLTVGKYTVFPMASPSYIVRQGGEEDSKGGERVRAAYFAVLARNITIMRGMQSGAKNPLAKEPVVKLCLTMKAVNMALDDLETKDVIAFDLETQGLWPASDKALHIVCLSGDGDTAYVIPFQHPKTPAEITENLDLVRKRLSHLLTTKRTVAQYAPFDMLWLRTKGVQCKCSFDTKYACHILDENVPTKLKARSPEDVPGQVEMYLGVPSGYSLDMSHADTYVWPLAELSKYGGMDAAYTWRLRGVHRERFKKEPRLMKLFVNMTMPAVELITQITMNGIAVDWDYLDEQSNEKGKGSKDKRVKAISRKLQKAMPPCPVKWTDGRREKPIKGDWATDDLGILLYNGLDFPVIEGKRTDKTGLASIKDEVIIDLRAEVEGHDKATVTFLNMVMEYGDLRKDQAFITGWRELRREDNRLHPTYHLDGAVTGRTSCREPNLQQTPRRGDMRRAFIARPGWGFLQVDYSQLELRLAADDAQEQVMLAIFSDPKGDIHTSTAAIVAGVPESKVDYQLRNKGKPINFGLLYGMSARGFQHYARYKYEVYFTLQEVEEAIKTFFKKYPGLKPWHKRRQAECKRTGEVVSCVGRKRRPAKIYSPNRAEESRALRQAVNSPIQGGGSDITLFAGTLMMPFDTEEILPVGFVHDAFLFEVRLDRMDFWHDRIKENFEGVRAPLKDKLLADIGVPLTADVEVGDSWAFA